MKYTVLIAEDDLDLVEMLKLYLSTEEFQILHANNGEEALEIVTNQKVDLLLADLMMPKMNGYELIQKLRGSSNIPVIIMSAKNEDTDKVMGLNIGADAYVTKPFNPFELIANIKALLRRYYQFGSGTKETEKENVIRLGNLTLNLDMVKLTKGEKEIALTSSEFKLLAKFMHNPGRVFTKHQLYESISNESYYVDENTIPVHISNLRAKIEDNPSSPQYIITIRGLGYKFEK